MIMYVTVPSCLRSDGNPYITYHFGLLDGLCSYLVYYRVSDLKMVFFIGQFLTHLVGFSIDADVRVLKLIFCNGHLI